MSPEDEEGEGAASLADDVATVGVPGVGGTTTGVGGCRARGVRAFLAGGVGLEEPRGDGEGLVSTPNELTSNPSASLTVPSERNACSKSISVRDIRRLAPEVAGCRPPGNDDGGIGERWG